MAKSGWYRSDGMTMDIRLDVDGDYPQNYASFSYGTTVHDIGPVTALGNDTWETTSLEHVGSQYLTGMTKLKVKYVNEVLQTQLIKADGSLLWSGNVPRKSNYFREAEVEFDTQSGVNAITSFNPHDDPNHAAGLANETLTVTSVYQKAGINITQSAGGGSVGVAGAGANSQWNSQELHDAMVANWSNAEAAAWKMWVFSASECENEPGWVTFGRMFDSIGNFQRCGTAVFVNAIKNYFPTNMLDNRNAFHTIIHEMGHAFNLAHSWQKTEGSFWRNGIVNEPEARSFMNYDWKVNGGENAFWANFLYRFSDQDLKFLRHAPENYVKMGDATWFSDHGAGAAESGAGVSLPQGAAESTQLQLKVRSNKANPVYEYLELVNVELKLTNSSNTDQEVPKEILDDVAHMTIRITRNGQQLKEHKPYSRDCYAAQQLILKPGESLYDSLFLSSGKFGWTVSEPGYYEVTVSVHVHDADGDKTVTSQPFGFAVAEPDQFNRQKRKEQETLAQDIFSNEVGRTLAFGGTKALTGANDVLKELTERFPDAKAAKHAAVALAMPNTREGYKLLSIDKNGKKAINATKANEKEGAQAIKKVLVDGGQEAIETLGHIPFQKMSDKAARELKAQGDDAGAKKVQQNVLTTLEKRGVKLPEKVKRDLEAKVKG